ncbi:MAG: hypothetical protein FJ010_03055 [Chloroflexi bacterium]|nr:hypothetical protein [Chloroflexota bacterium]
MLNIPLKEIIAKMPVAELEQTMSDFLLPVTELLPEERLRRVVPEAVRGILAQETPVIAAMAQSTPRQERSCYAGAKRIYRFVWNERFNHHRLFKGLYRVAQRTVAGENPERLVVAVDPVNFEKPYTKKLEGVSTVRKSTPPDLKGEARLAHGYPAITATVVNTVVPATSYANWFSYKTADFISENREIQRAIRTTRWVFPGRKLRFVMDSGGDDQKNFAFLEPDEFIITAKHMNRMVEVYNPRLDRWETEHLQDLVDCVPWQVTYQVAFHHAGRTRLANLKMGWFLVRLPETHQQLWVLVAEDDLHPNTLTLLTNIPILAVTIAQEVYSDWRLRGRIEHGYRFDQEQGLDVEDLRVHTVERMRRIFALVLLAAQYVFSLAKHWPPKAVLWLRKLGGKFGLKTDRDGPYILLRGLSAVWQCATTISWLAVQPFPHHLFQPP